MSDIVGKLDRDAINYSEMHINLISLFDNGVKIGYMNIDDEGDLFFKGNAKESAKIFFDEVCRLHSSEVMRLKAIIENAGLDCN